MKHIFTYTLSIVFACVATTSCQKSGKQGIANTWRVIGHSETTTYENGSAYTTNNGDTPANPNELIIKEDGTWSWNRKATYTATVFGGSVFLTKTEVTAQEGTWSPVNRIEQHTKNQYVLFNTLYESVTTAHTGGGGNPIFPDTTITKSKTYGVGENAVVYKVVNWDRDEMLQLESENTQPNSSGELKNSKLILVVKK